MMTTATKQHAIYAMCVRGYEGAVPSARFTFTAESPEDASQKAHNWARYHGYSYYTDDVNSRRSDVVVRYANTLELQWETNNEYLR